jgi:hypothetical protein
METDDRRSCCVLCFSVEKAAARFRSLQHVGEGVRRQSGGVSEKGKSIPVGIIDGCFHQTCDDDADDDYY